VHRTLRAPLRIPSAGSAATNTMLRTYLVLIALSASAWGAALCVGAGDLGHAELGATFLALRATRAGAAFLIGMALAVAGVLVQGMFRNPLASPSILGTTAGASLGGRLALLGFEPLLALGAARYVPPDLLLSAGCLLGALLSLGIVLGVHQVGDDLVVLLLAGFLLSSLFVSLGGFVTSLAQERWELARALVTFALGDVSGVGLRRLALVVPMVLAGVLAAWLWSHHLDLLLSGEEEAASLGVDVRRVRHACVVWTAVLTAAAVSIGGNVSFVGLIVPHVLRPFVGESHRRLVPACAVLGGAFLVACDALTRALPTRSEIPLGVITGVIGAPLFLILLVRSRRELAYG
jgi:iron complex transport system permease protein